MDLCRAEKKDGGEDELSTRLAHTEKEGKMGILILRLDTILDEGVV